MYHSNGESFPAYWGAHALCVNNRSIPRILEAKHTVGAMDVDGFFMRLDTGLKVYQFYTGHARQLHMGSRTSGYATSLYSDFAAILTWFIWSRGLNRTPRRPQVAA